jgi:hypothetical protein
MKKKIADVLKAKTDKLHNEQVIAAKLMEAKQKEYKSMVSKQMTKLNEEIAKAIENFVLNTASVKEIDY